MKYLFVLFLLSISLCYSDARSFVFHFSLVVCGEYEMEDDMCFYFSCDNRNNTDSCLPISSSYLPDYFTSSRTDIL